MKIRFRLFIVFLVSILASTVLSAALLLYIQNRSYQKQMARLHEDTMQSMKSNIIQLTGSVDRTSSVAFSNRLTQSVLRSIGDGGMTFENQTYIKDFLNLLITSEGGISSASFYDLKGRACYAVRDSLYIVNDIRVQSMDWYSDVTQAGGDWVYDSGIQNYAEPNDEKIVLTMTRQIKSRGDLTPIGYLQVNIGSEIFSRIFSSGSSPSACYQLLHNGETVYSSGQLENTGRNGTIRETDLPMEGWAIRGEIPSTFSLPSENLIIILLIIFINISCLALCWFSTNRYVSRPLQQMSETLISQRSVESLPVGFDVAPHQQDEISILKRSFNDLLSSVRQLTTQREENARLLREKDLLIVTEQIRPHFLYNTLDTISGMILNGEDKSAFSMIQSLGQFYRTSLGNGESSIPLSEELSMTADYLRIMNLRFDQHTLMVTEVPAYLTGIRVPKLILQPIVENAILHGNSKGDGFVIKIEGTASEDILSLRITDNGSGMDSEKEEYGIGLQNVRDRLQLTYGIPDPLQIQSFPGHGTEVILQIGINERIV